MCGNGAVTGMALIHRQHKPIPRGLQLAPIACFVAVAGTNARRTAVFLVGTTMLPSVATVTAACV